MNGKSRKLSIKAKGGRAYELAEEEGRPFEQNIESAASSLSAVGGMTQEQAKQLLELMDRSVS